MVSFYLLLSHLCLVSLAFIAAPKNIVISVSGEPLVGSDYVCDTSPEFRSQVLGDLISGLQEEGYEVYMSHFSKIDAPMGNLNGDYFKVSFNGIPEVEPPAIWEYILEGSGNMDVITANYAGGDQMETWNLFEEYGNYSWPLTKSDGMFTLFCTPPSMKYYSLGLYSGFGFGNEDPSTNTGLSWIQNAELTSPVNMLRINTTQSESDSGDSLDGKFNTTAGVITTGSEKMRQLLLSLLNTKTQLPNKAVNNLNIPESSSFRYWNNRDTSFSDILKDDNISGMEKPTTVQTLFRTAYANNQEQLESYINQYVNKNGIPILYIRNPNITTEAEAANINGVTNQPASFNPETLQAIAENDGVPTEKDTYQSSYDSLLQGITDMVSQELNMRLVDQIPLTDMLPNNTRCLIDNKYFFMDPNIYVPGWENSLFDYMKSLYGELEAISVVDMFFTENGTLKGMPNCDVYTVDALYEQAPFDQFKNMLYQDNRTFILVGVNHEATNMASYSQMMFSGTSPNTAVETPTYSWEFNATDFSSTYTANNNIYKTNNVDINGIDESLLQNMYVLPISPICYNLTSVLPECFNIGYQGPYPTTLEANNQLPGMTVLGIYGRNYANPTTTYGSPAEAVVLPTLLIFDAPGADGGSNVTPSTPSTPSSGDDKLTNRDKIIIVVVCCIVGVVVIAFIVSKVMVQNKNKKEEMRKSLLRKSENNTEDAINAL